MKVGGGSWMMGWEESRKKRKEKRKKSKDEGGRMEVKVLDDG